MKRNASIVQMPGLFLCMLLLGNSASSAVGTPSAQEIAKNAFGATVLVVMEDVGGHPLALGSGFFVRDTEVATNLHVVGGAAKGYVKPVGQKAKYDIEGMTAVESNYDLVILKVSGRCSATLQLGDSDGVQVGESVYAVGNPQGLEGTFSQGIISSIREIGTDKLLQITAPISPGSSGGPVLNSAGDVIGVSVATFTGGQNLNFAIPSGYLKALLAKTASVTPLVQSETPKPKKSIFEDLGGNSTQGVVAGQLTWKYPDNPYPGMGGFDFSLQNKMRDSVQNVCCLVAFYDAQKNPVDVQMIQCPYSIPAGLAKRVNGEVEISVRDMARRGGRVEFRILDFQLKND